MPDKIVKQFTAETRSVAGDERGVELVISTEELDRDGETISADGWKLDNYRRNPVVLWAHDYKSLPVATARKITAGEGVLRAVAHFVEAEISPLAETVLQMLKRGYLSAASVGFQPLKWAPNEHGGRDYTEQELLEFSIVPVPANPSALVARAHAAGLDLAPLVKWATGLVTESRSTPTPPTAALDAELFELIGLTEPRGGFDLETAMKIGVEHMRDRLPQIVDRALRKRQGRLD